MSRTGAGIRRTSKLAVYEQFCTGDFDLKQKGVLAASFAKNCDFEKGALRSGFGAKRYYLESEPERVLESALMAYGHPKMVFTAMMKTADGSVKRTIGSQADMNRVYVYDIDTQAVKYLGKAQDLLKVLSYVYPNGTAKMIFCTAKELFFYEFPDTKTEIFSGDLSGACLFHERLFVATKHSLKYSAPFEIENFEPSLNGGGEIAFDSDRGEIVWVESFGESIYLFFEYGIAKLEAGGAGSEFVVSDIPYNGGRILPRTVCAYEDRLVFAGFEGIFVFDGKKCSKLGARYATIKDNILQAYAGCVGNRYFLYYMDEKENCRSFFVDLADERNGCECFPVYGLNVSGGKALFSCDYVYSYLDRDGDLPRKESYLFSVLHCDFGSRAEKSLKYLSLQGVGKCVVKVKGRTGVRTIAFDLGERESVGFDGEINAFVTDMVGGNRKTVGLKGREFGFEITLQKGCVIRKMAVEYDEIGGAK